MGGFPGADFAVQEATAVALAAVRVTYTQVPRALDPTAANDSLNPANYTLSGPSVNYVTSVVKTTDAPLCVDLYLAAPLTIGQWSVAVANVVEDTGDALENPKVAEFVVNYLATQEPVSGGAQNSDVEQILRKFLNPALKGPNWDALIAGLAAGDKINWDNARSAFDQLFVCTASGKYLDRKAGDWGQRRPSDVAMSDTIFRRLAILARSQKLTQNAILSLLEVFYGEEACRATITTGASEPFVLEDNDSLDICLDERITARVTFSVGGFARIGAATATEVAAVITRELSEVSDAFAFAVTDPTTGVAQVRIHSGSLGMGSSVRIVGGRAQTRLLFPHCIFADAPVTPRATWTVAVSPTDQNRMRFQLAAGSIFNLENVEAGDLVYIYGNPFSATACIGTFEILDVYVGYPGGVRTEWFEIEAHGVPLAPVVQNTYAELMFFRPVKRTVHDALRRVLVCQNDNTLDIILPATTQVVSRGPGSGAYGQTATGLTVLTAARNSSGVVEVRTVGPHLLLPGNQILLSGVYPKQASPANYTAGTPSGAYGGGVASGVSNVDVLSCVSTPGTMSRSYHKALRLPEGEVLFLGGLSVDNAALPGAVTAVTQPEAFLQTSETSNAGRREINYDWRQLASVLTTGYRDFGASVLADGRVLITGGYDGTNETSNPTVNARRNVLTYQIAPPAEALDDDVMIPARAAHAQTTMSNEVVLVSGGWDAKYNEAINTCAVYTPSSDSWMPAAPMTAARLHHETVSLPNGHVLAIGGRQPARMETDANDCNYWSFDTDYTDSIGGNTLSSGAADTVEFAGKIGHCVRPGTAIGGLTGLVTAAGPAQTALNAVLVGQEWSIQAWITAGEGVIWSNGGVLGGGAGTNTLITFGIYKSSGLPDPNDGYFYWSWDRGNHVRNIHYSTVYAPDLFKTYEANWEAVWHHVALVKARGAVPDSYDVMLYVDGVLVDQAPPWLNAQNGANGAFYLCSDPADGGVLGFSGYIDELRVSTVARTAHEIRTAYLMQRGVTQFDGPEYWYKDHEIGKCLNSCETYDPVGNVWSPAGSMAKARFGFATVVLPDSRIVAIGGYGYNPTQGTDAVPLSSCEIYDPATKLWSSLPDMAYGREYPTAVYIPSTNSIVVGGGRNVTCIEIFELSAWKWRKSTASVATTGRYRTAGGLVASDLLVLGGGSYEQASAALYPAPAVNKTADLTLPAANNLFVPGLERWLAGGLNRVATVTGVAGPENFRYETKDTSYPYTASETGTVVPMGAPAAVVGMPGPFSYDTKSGFAVTGTEGLVDADYNRSRTYSSIRLKTTVVPEPAMEFPAEGGYLVFAFGTDNVVGPVRYYGRISITELAIDGGFKFPVDVPNGTQVTLLAGRSPYAPPRDSGFGNFYVTPSASGRAAAIQALDETVAGGLNINIDVNYPGDRGLGGEGLPAEGASKLSDKVSVWGGDDLDAELALARDE